MADQLTWNRKVVLSARSSAVLVLVALAPMTRVHAQWAVIDAGAIVQLVQEVETLEQQLQTARDQLTQAKEALSTTTGNRGMSRLLSGTVRNYLPSTWADLTSMERGSGTFPNLSASVRAVVGANAVLSAQQLATLPATDQQQLVSARQTAALQQTVAGVALVNVSGRFAAIQSLVDAISGAGDQKSILELQARIVAELGMLQNEQTKLQVLAQSSQAQRAADAQREREYVFIADGTFGARFHPRPSGASLTP